MTWPHMSSLLRSPIWAREVSKFLSSSTLMDGCKGRRSQSREGNLISVKNLGTEEKLPRREISPRGGGGALTSSGRTG